MGDLSSIVGAARPYGPPTFPPNRFYVLDGGLEMVIAPAGADPDGVSMCGGVAEPGRGYAACPGQPFQVEAGGEVSPGDRLEVGPEGRAVRWQRGVPIARTLKAGGTGSPILGVWLSGR